MRVSQFYGLSGNQGTFDFIDVNIESDTPLFIDPTVLRSLDDPWAEACASDVQGFFQRVLDAIVGKDTRSALGLLSHLNEENATHLGYSARSRGSGVGDGLAQQFFDELRSSDAVKSGLITDLEDTALLIPGVGEDRISDVVTNIIRKHLVEYTQEASRYYGIPLTPNVNAGYHWDNAAGQWGQLIEALPTPNGPLLLVPKAITRRVLHYDAGAYYRHYVLNYFRDYEIDQKSSLTFLLKDGRRKVYKKDVEKKWRDKHGASDPGVTKRVSNDATKRDPSLLDAFKVEREQKPPAILSHDEVADYTGTSTPDYQELLRGVLDLRPGDADADRYEKAVERLLSALFYPNLISPKPQHRIHDGRKRIDIAYTNPGRSGFFEWLSANYPAAHIYCECKNYGKEIGNPEYDQLSSRFSPSRGRIGLLVYRGYADKAKVLQHCLDTAHDARGWIVALDDQDLATLVTEAGAGMACALGGLLHKRFLALIDN